MMEVEGALLMLTPLCRFKSALLLGRKARRSRSTLTHLLKRRCLSDRGFYEVAQADATAAVKCSTMNTPKAVWRKVEGAPVSGMGMRHSCVKRFRRFARLEDARTASGWHRA